MKPLEDFIKEEDDSSCMIDGNQKKCYETSHNESLSTNLSSQDSAGGIKHS